MVHIYSLYIILAAASALAAPIAQRDSQDLSSHTGNEIIDNTTPANLVLPPVDAVFAMMAAGSASSPSASSTFPSATTDVLHLGPGPVETSPTGIVSPSEHHGLPSDGNLLTHRFIFASVAILSMVAVVLAVYACSYHSSRRYEQRMNMVQSPAPIDEKEDLKGRCSIVDISRNFPRSKFSVTSSDYPISARAPSCDSESESESETDSSSNADSTDYRNSTNSNGSYGRGLMNPALFFALRSSSMAASRRHSRNGSAPVFGVPRFDAGREQSRRSRSVSNSRQEWI
ncbi:hypothetical protein B0H12DRAFT_1098970 [Mycena haematopus]|nr:hypothetical protein B0H12DRAFT_1098970 [Mycena haematopus]